MSDAVGVEMDGMDGMDEQRRLGLEGVEHQGGALGGLGAEVVLKKENAVLGGDLDARGEVGVGLDEDPVSGG